MSREMSPSILTSVKKSLGISQEIDAFDPDLILLINSEFGKLHQLGVGPETPFSIQDEIDEWEDFTSDETLLGMVREFVYLSVRLVFDPPTASVLTEMKNKVSELEWRLNVAGDSPIDRSDQNEQE